MNNKIENLFEHKRDENKFTHIMKDLGSFIVTLPTKILEFACNLIDVILDFPRSIITNAARIFETTNTNCINDAIKSLSDDLLKNLVGQNTDEQPCIDKIDNLDMKFNNFMIVKIVQFDQKINPPIVSSTW